MTQDEIIRMAKEAGMEQDGDNFYSPSHEEIDVHITDLTRFAQLVAEREREECAKLVEGYDEENWMMLQQADCAEAIRARGNK